ncbi:hypothetical protein VNO77_02857 [Canavalia gladiata]|uniref:Uncharacterized protein n=1 Tax=Canavalia gladiata TaxID=3824 RepID=A0AAN9R6A6_CANGL
MEITTTVIDPADVGALELALDQNDVSLFFTESLSLHACEDRLENIGSWLEEGWPRVDVRSGIYDPMHSQYTQKLHEVVRPLNHGYVWREFLHNIKTTNGKQVEAEVSHELLRYIRCPCNRQAHPYVRENASNLMKGMVSLNDSMVQWHHWPSAISRTHVRVPHATKFFKTLARCSWGKLKCSRLGRSTNGPCKGVPPHVDWAHNL